MGFLGPIIGVGAAWLFFRDDSFWLGCIAAVLSLISFWTWGIMHNQATEAAKRRSSFRGGFSDFTASEVDAVNNKLAAINFLSTLGATALMVVALARVSS